jgi:hypothetical protein
MSSDLPARQQAASDPSEQETPSKRQLFERFLESQEQEFEIKKQEIAIRREELELRKQESVQGYEFAQKSLGIQAADLKEVRAQEKRESWQFLTLALALILIVAAVLTYAIGSNKDQFVLELTRIILTALGGGGVGYVAGHRNRKKEASDDEN